MEMQSVGSELYEVYEDVNVYSKSHTVGSGRKVNLPTLDPCQSVGLTLPVWELAAFKRPLGTVRRRVQQRPELVLTEAIFHLSLRELEALAKYVMIQAHTQKSPS